MIDPAKKIQVEAIDPSLHNYLLYTSIVEAIVIVILIVIILKRRTIKEESNVNTAKIKEARTSTINMDDLMDNINNSRSLYKELSSKCHPDKFIGSDMHNLASDLFQEITQNERNSSKLKLLKIRAVNELNVTF